MNCCGAHECIVSLWCTEALFDACTDSFGLVGMELIGGWWGDLRVNFFKSRTAKIDIPHIKHDETTSH
jgi:hypothetical protein